MSIGENIKSLRESRGLTQAQLGDAVGVSDKAVSTWESGKREPRMGAVEKLAAFFGLDKSELLFGAGYEKTAALAGDGLSPSGCQADRAAALSDRGSEASAAGPDRDSIKPTRMRTFSSSVSSWNLSSILSSKLISPPLRPASRFLLYPLCCRRRRKVNELS